MDFIDLKSQQKLIREKIGENIDKVLDHGRYVMGPEIGELEEKLAKYCGVKHGVGVASGTDALLISLMAYDVGPGDAIFTTPFTFIATAEVIRLLGATPVFTDIDSDTFNIDCNRLESDIERVLKEKNLKPKGIIPVDLFGQPADYDEIESIAKKYGMFVMEDAAQSFGADYKDKKACSLGDIAATSFFPAKPLGAYGDGGMVFTNSDEIFEKVVSIRIHGKGSDKYDNIRVGVNGRLDTIQAAILLAKFNIFDEEVKKRQKVADNYNRLLEGVVKTPVVKDDRTSAWAQYAMIHQKRDKIIEKLREENIPIAIYYPIPLHLQKAFFSLGYKKGDFPVSEKCADEIFSIPFHPYLKTEDQEKIADTIKEAI